MIDFYDTVFGNIYIKSTIQNITQGTQTTYPAGAAYETYPISAQGIYFLQPISIVYSPNDLLLVDFDRRGANAADTAGDFGFIGWTVGT